jgi:hypothetical protein
MSFITPKILLRLQTKRKDLDCLHSVLNKKFDFVPITTKV